MKERYLSIHQLHCTNYFMLCLNFHTEKFPKNRW